MSIHRFWIVTNSIWSCLLLAWTAAVTLWTAAVTLEPGGVVDRAYMAVATRKHWKIPGYRRYVAKYPFVIEAAETFPRDKCFAVLFYDTPGIFLSVDKSDFRPGQELLLGIGEHFAFSCDYSVAGGKVVVCELSVNVAEGEWLTDLNADGQFDMRNVRKENREGEVAVWFNNSWVPIIDAIGDPDQNLYHKRLVTGENVVFDQAQGKWVLDVPERGHRTERRPETK